MEDVAHLFLDWKFSTYCWVLDISTCRWSASVSLWKIKTGRGKHGGEKKSDCFYGDDKYVHNLCNFDHVNFLSFFFSLFYDLIDNGILAKKWSTKTISILCKLDQSGVGVDWYIAYNYFLMRKGLLFIVWNFLCGFIF